MAFVAGLPRGRAVSTTGAFDVELDLDIPEPRTYACTVLSFWAWLPKAKEAILNMKLPSHPRQMLAKLHTTPFTTHTMLEHNGEFLPEIWSLYGVGTFWLVLRCFVRIRTLGFLGLQLDDAFSFVVLVCWTIICVGIHITYYTGTAVDYTPAEIADFDSARIKELEYGSKLYLLTWYAYITMVWSLKATVVIFYRRLAFGDWQTRLLKFTTYFCIASWVSMIFVISFTCWPYHGNWQVRPLPGSLACTAKPRAFITLSCLNALGDVFLLGIPIPLLWRLKLPPLKKIAIVVLLSSGIFVMAACITRVSLTVVPNVSIRVIARWGVRELCIAILAVNTMILRPMFRKSFWVRSNPAVPHKKNYVFASLQRIQRALSRNQAPNFVLNSASPGVTTIEQFNEQNSHDDGRPFEDPDYQVRAMSNMEHQSTTRDLEKGEGPRTTVSVSEHS